MVRWSAQLVALVGLALLAGHWAGPLLASPSQSACAGAGSNVSPPAVLSGPLTVADRPASSLNVGPVHILPPPPPQGQPSVPVASPSPTCPVTYHNGPVLHTTTTYAIFWLPIGAHFEPTGTAASDMSYENVLTSYLQHVGNTVFYNLLTQYSDSVNGPPLNSSTFGGSYVYTAPYPHAGTPGDPLLDANLQAAIEASKAANGWAGSATNSN